MVLRGSIRAGLRSGSEYAEGEREGRGLRWSSGSGRADWAERWEKEKKMGRGAGLTGERNKEERAGLVFVVGLETGFGFPSFLSLSSFSNKLKPFEFKFEFEFNPSTQTNKTMHQHECTTKLALK